MCHYHYPTPFISYPRHTHLHAHTPYSYHDEGMCGCPSFISCQKDVSLSSLWGREKKRPPNVRAFKSLCQSHAHEYTCYTCATPTLCPTHTHIPPQSNLISQWRCDWIWQRGSVKIALGLRFTLESWSAHKPDQGGNYLNRLHLASIVVQNLICMPAFHVSLHSI